jgi:hypothetical protein
MGKVRDTMKQIGIRNRPKTNLDNAQCLIQWVAKKHPKVLTEYLDSEFFKILTRTNQYVSVMEAMHFLDTGKDE